MDMLLLMLSKKLGVGVGVWRKVGNLQERTHMWGECSQHPPNVFF